MYSGARILSILGEQRYRSQFIFGHLTVTISILLGAVIDLNFLPILLWQSMLGTLLYIREAT